MMQSNSTPVLKKAGDHDYLVVEKPDESLGIFQPLIVQAMKNSTSTFYDQSTMQDKEISVEDYIKRPLRQIEQRRTSIQIDKQDYDKAQVLETFAIGLQVTLTELNVDRTEIDKTSFEALIEKDFIDQEQPSK